MQLSTCRVDDKPRNGSQKKRSYPPNTLSIEGSEDKTHTKNKNGNPREIVLTSR